jgi:hypothetical protein
MFEDDAERQTTSLRGRLADVYYPALLGDSQDALAIRLGERAMTYNPLFGWASGLDQIRPHLKEVAAWLETVGASYTHGRTLVGLERDVSEGGLSLRSSSRHIELPVAVVMERRKAREVDLRAYHAALPLGHWQAKRPPRVLPDKEQTLAADVATHLAALRLGDADALVSGFETDGTLRDGAGRVHGRGTEPGTREQGSPNKLHEYYVQLLQNARGANDWVPIVRSAADDGRTCAVEFETEKTRGDESTPKEGLFLFERGDSGLFRSVRVYDEVGYDDEPRG